MSEPAACSSRSPDSIPTSVYERAVGRPRLERHRSRSRIRPRRRALVQFQRVGPRVLLVQANQSFRSSSKNPLERKSVEDSFAKSILWGFAVAAESIRTRPRRRHRFLPARCRECRGEPAARQLPRRSHAQRLLPAQHAQLPEEHRSRHDVDVRQRADRRRWWRRWRSDPGSRADRRGRRRWWRWRWRVRRRIVLRIGRQRDAVARSGDHARARVVRASCRTPRRSSRASTIRAPVTAA